jgi:hypothetical protein
MKKDFHPRKESLTDFTFQILNHLTANDTLGFGR